jgi:hypothetical protein
MIFLKVIFLFDKSVNDRNNKTRKLEENEFLVWLISIVNWHARVSYRVRNLGQFARGGGVPATVDDSQCQFLGLDTARPYVADLSAEVLTKEEYEGKYGGMKAHYLLRWVTHHGDKGPWSETVSATIAG